MRWLRKGEKVAKVDIVFQTVRWYLRCFPGKTKLPCGRAWTISHPKIVYDPYAQGKRMWSMAATFGFIIWLKALKRPILKLPNVCSPCSTFACFVRKKNKSLLPGTSDMCFPSWSSSSSSALFMSSSSQALRDGIWSVSRCEDGFQIVITSEKVSKVRHNHSNRSFAGTRIGSLADLGRWLSSAAPAQLTIVLEEAERLRVYPAAFLHGLLAMRYGLGSVSWEGI